MNSETLKNLHKKYANDDASFELIYTHCQIVADIALDAVQRNRLIIDQDLLRTACILHDIGCYTLWMPCEQTFKEDGYQQHALIGAAILAEEGLPELIVQAVRTHVLMGLTASEISQHAMKIPYKNTLPANEIGKLLCYADRFHSKHPKFNDPDTFMANLAKNLPSQATEFENAIKKYGSPNLAAFSKKYGHQIV